MAAFLIVGLGNPGREYKDTRHNIGYQVLDHLAAKLDIKIGRVQQQALVGSGRYKDDKIILAKPITYMNRSGIAAAGLLRYYQIDQKNFLAVHDDLDLPFGTLRLRAVGGSAGQKGMNSIIEQAGTNEFARLRCGIGRPPGRMDAADYVLESFSPVQMKEMPFVLDTAVKAILTFLDDGIAAAMNQYNGSVLEEN